jgi:hypothetical protein
MLRPLRCNTRLFCCKPSTLVNTRLQARLRCWTSRDVACTGFARVRSSLAVFETTRLMAGGLETAELVHNVGSNGTGEPAGCSSSDSHNVACGRMRCGGDHRSWSSSARVPQSC